MADIFISYAREDRPHAERLGEALEPEGFDVWWDRDSLRSGQSFNRAIQQALVQAKCVVVLWSGTSVGSKWVESEAYWAWEHDKLHSVRLDDSVPLPVPFNTFYARSLASWDGGAAFPEFQRLSADIAAVVGARERKREAPPLSQTMHGVTGSIMADIFLSYAREDWQRIRPLAQCLEAQGWSVWWDTRMRAGRRFDEMIETEIAAARCVIVVWTEISVKSYWVRAEAAEALEQDKLIPVFLDVVKLPLLFRHVQGLDFRAWQGSADEPAFLRLVEDAGQVAGAPAGLGDEASLDRPRIGGEPSPPRKPSKQPPRSGPTSPAAASVRDPNLPEPEMVRIKPGTFLMGCPMGEAGDDDERPQHEVRIAGNFAIGKYAVTFDEYDAFAKATQRDLPSDEGWGRGRRPVINVSWEDAVAYAQWLSEMTGKLYRLPAEAEWEYAARAGTKTPYSTGNCIDTAKANYDGNYDWGDCPKTGLYREQTVEVGSLPANPWGLHEVHGNVYEWVQDCWNDSYQGAPADGSAWEAGDCARRVLRGG